VFCVIAGLIEGLAAVQARQSARRSAHLAVQLSGDLIHDVKDRPTLAQPRAEARLRQLRENAVYEQRANMSRAPPSPTTDAYLIDSAAIARLK
jgi:hypothetical protein